MQTSVPHSFDNLTKDELIELLEAEQAKNETLLRFIGSIFHEVRAPTAIVLGFANLLLMEAETSSSHSNFVKYVHDIKKAAKRIQDANNLHSAWWRMLRLLRETPAKTKIVLAELHHLEQSVGIPITIDLAQIPPIVANEEVVLAVMESLRYVKRDEAELIIREDGEYVHFILSNWAELSYWVDKYLDNDGNRLVCNDKANVFEPMCLVIALIEKYGGAVYAELGDDSTYTISFTLPVYREGV